MTPEVHRPEMERDVAGVIGVRRGSAEDGLGDTEGGRRSSGRRDAKLAAAGVEGAGVAAGVDEDRPQWRGELRWRQAPRGWLGWIGQAARRRWAAGA